jgi:hypothetical protein
MKKRKIDWFRVLIIATLAVAVVWVSIVLGKSPIGIALGGEASLTWAAPTRNCDGTSLTNLTGYSLTYGQKREALPTTPLSKTVTGLTPGTWWFSLAAVTPTARSEFVTVEKVIPPEQFVTKTTTVYTFAKAEGNILVLPTLHKVALGTQCDATQSVNGKYIIPRSSVTWSGSARPVAVLGDCG